MSLITTSILSVYNGSTTDTGSVTATATDDDYECDIRYLVFNNLFRPQEIELELNNYLYPLFVTALQLTQLLLLMMIITIDIRFRAVVV